MVREREGGLGKPEPFSAPSIHELWSGFCPDWWAGGVEIMAAEDLAEVCWCSDTAEDAGNHSRRRKVCLLLCCLKFRCGGGG